jgi:hypothetical protein
LTEEQRLPAGGLDEDRSEEELPRREEEDDRDE